MVTISGVPLIFLVEKIDGCATFGCILYAEVVKLVDTQR